MLGHKEREQLELFITGSLRQLIPDDHVLVRVDDVLDLSWLRDEVSECYCLDDGRPGIDPEVAVRLMLAGLLTGVVHDRKLMREAQVNIAVRWFISYSLHKKLPHHSSLTRIRQRWGEERFRKIFKRTVEAWRYAHAEQFKRHHRQLRSPELEALAQSRGQQNPTNREGNLDPALSLSRRSAAGLTRDAAARGMGLQFGRHHAHA